MQTKEQRNVEPPFSKDELRAYIEERGYVISSTDLDNWWDWFVSREFCYVQGKQRIRLVNWKNYVNIQLRNRMFNVKKKVPPKPVEKPPEIISPTPEQKAKLHQEFKSMIKSLNKKMTPKIYRNRGIQLTKVRRQIKELKG